MPMSGEPCPTAPQVCRLFALGKLQKAGTRMDAGEGTAPLVLGYLTVVEHPQHGLFGGYLLLNHLGRPLEFHCTAPVKASRAQEILYGATLKPFLYGEQIGKTLIGKGKAKSSLVLTDAAEMLAVREFVAPPVALVESVSTCPGVEPVRPEVATDDPLLPPARQATWRIDAAHPPGTGWVHVHFGGQRLALSAAHSADQDRVSHLLRPLPAHFDLSEPFERIRSAIEEAQRGAR